MLLLIQIDIPVIVVIVNVNVRQSADRSSVAQTRRFQINLCQCLSHRLLHLLRIYQARAAAFAEALNNATVILIVGGGLCRHT